MIRPKTVKLRDVKRMFAAFHVQYISGTTIGHKRPRHAMLCAPGGGKFPLPYRNDSDDVFRTYIEAARRKFHLTPADGVADKDFYGKL